MDFGEYIYAVANMSLLFTVNIPRGVFCECNKAEVTEPPGLKAPNQPRLVLSSCKGWNI